MEGDTFAVVSSAPSQESLAGCLQVLQETPISQPTHSQLVSPHTKVIAIVDRTADLAAAAENLVTARFAFGGSSPYAPDLVFVNEYVKKEFLEHVLKFAIPYLAASGASDSPSSSSPSPQKGTHTQTASALKTLQTSTTWLTNTITQGSKGAILDLTALAALPPKTRSPLFAITAITSLEHAISLIDEDAETTSGPLLAGYYFGTPSTGKYLSQFIAADLSTVNHIPYRLLLGPAAPAHHAPVVDARYAPALFVRAAPALITPSGEHARLGKMLSAKDARHAGGVALELAAREIKEKKRAEWIAIGYFEQGILIGLGVYGVPLLACIGTGLFYGVRAGLRRFAFI